MIDIARAVHESNAVRKATPDQAETLAALLARAFYDDPAMRWVIIDNQRRGELLKRSFGLYLRKLWFKQDECYTTGSSVGAIVWERPGQWKAGIIDQCYVCCPRWRASTAGFSLGFCAGLLPWRRIIRRAALLPAVCRRRTRVARPGAGYRADAPGT